MEDDIIKKIPSGKATILFLDDERMVLDVGKHMLEKLGYHVYVAESGEQAIDLYQKYQHQIDLVIIDMVLPGLTGGQIYDRLKKINPDIKTLLSSGYSIRGEATDILSRGCNGFIQKPFGIFELGDKIRTILDE